MNQRERSNVGVKILVSLAIFGLTNVGIAAQTFIAKSTTITPKAVAPVSNPCPRFAAGSPVQREPALFSQNGVLSVQFSYQTVLDSANRNLFCFMTPSGMENPTLYVSPGDTLNITITNNTPFQAGQMAINPPNCGDNKMTPSSVNIHYHGTNTSPTCGSDEVIKTTINPTQTFQYSIAFPSNEPPGLYWYHPHVHGLAENAVLGGAAGAIVVQGIQNVQPKVSGLTSRVFVIRDQLRIQNSTVAESGAGTSNGVPFRDLTVNNIPENTTTDSNGNTTYTPAVLRMEADDDPEFWRISNSSSDSILDLQLQYDGKPQNLQLVAIDGVAVNSQDGSGPGQLISVTDFRLPPASRVEFIIHPPSRTVKLAQLVTLNIPANTNGVGDDDPNRPIFTIQQTNGSSITAARASKATPDSRVPKFTAFTTAPQRFAGIQAAPITAYHTVFFDENGTTNQFFMVVQGQPEMTFNGNAPPAITSQQGTVEQWTVENHTLENHEFHFHQIHFMVKSQNNFETNGFTQVLADNTQFLDMIEVPAWDGNAGDPYPSVTLLMDFRGPDVGIFVFHCHILNHEDLGMMNIIQVVGGSAKSGGPSDKGSAAAPVKSSALHSEAGTAMTGPGGGSHHH